LVGCAIGQRRTGVIEARECGLACDRIAGFVQGSLDASNRSGIAVAMSGGLDS
jgi:hypothetical protein